MDNNEQEQEWFPFTCEFGKNWINEEGKLLSPIWFKDTSVLYEDEWTWVQNMDGDCNYINDKGNFLLAEWYGYASQIFFIMLVGKMDKLRLLKRPIEKLKTSEIIDYETEYIDVG
jgi:hypothetical protein